MNRFYSLLEDISNHLKGQVLCGGDCGKMDEDEYNDPNKEKLEDELGLEMLKRKLEEMRQGKSSEGESIEEEMMAYKKEFYEMSVGSIKAIATHAQSILAALNNPSVAQNLTESWLQGKIAVTEDYMRTIHDFVMFVSEATDNESTDASKPGLWDNIRKKKERMGKKYRPAKPGDKDRPDPEQWKKLTK